MPSRNSAAKCWELASRSLKDTAATSTLRLSDIYAYASHPMLSIARLTGVVQQGRAGSFRHCCRQRQTRKHRGLPRNGGENKKEPPLPAAQSDNREASNRVDRSHSMSRSWTNSVMNEKA